MAVFVYEDGTGLSNAVSLASTAYCREYFAFSPFSEAIDDMTDEELEKFLATSTRQIQSAVKWRGAPVKYIQYVDPVNASYQGCDWPRIGITLRYQTDDPVIIHSGTENLGSQGSFEVPSNIVPTPVLNAVCENVRYQQAGDRALDKDDLEFESAKVDVIEVKWLVSSRSGTVPDDVLSMLSDYVETSSKSGGIAGGSARIRRTG